MMGTLLLTLNKWEIVSGDLGGHYSIYGDGIDNTPSDDKLYGDAGNDKLYGNYGNDILSGGSGADSLDGSAGNDSLSGDSGDDILLGGSGNDILTGGSDRDTLTGGSGNDTFKFKNFGGANWDFVEDFIVGADKIALSKAAFSAFTQTGALASAQFYKSVSGVAHDTSDRIIYETDTGALYYDADGSGSGEAQIVAYLAKNLPLTEASFIIVA